MPILVDDTLLKSKQNIGGIPDFINKPNNNNNICNLDEFKERINIFCTHNPNYDIFEFVEWEKDKIALCGSIMAACLQKYHPLMELFDNIKNNNEKLSRFYNEYYGLADIDIMFLSNNDFEYMSIVQKFYNQIVVNICRFYPTYAEPNHIKLISDKIAYLFIDNDTCLKLFNNSYETIAEVKKTIEEPETKKFFEPLFIIALEKIKKERLNKFTNEELLELRIKYPDYFDFDNIPFRIRFTKSKLNTNNLIINYKYKIKSPYINHILELFPVKYNDFFCTIQSFHLPCVRSYYDGNNVYMTPSCISAHLTYMNIDYKYFAGSRDPIDIINKYRMRGFGTWLNENEKKILLKYSKHNIFWNNLYNISDNNTTNKIEGFLSLNHNLYHPRIYNLDYYHEACPIDWTESYNTNNKSKQIETIPEFYSELSNRYKNSNKFNFLDNMKAIGINGSIKKLQKWVIEGCWNIVQSNTIKKIDNEIITKKNIKNNCDISEIYNLSNKDNTTKINKIQTNYTPQQIIHGFIIDTEPIDPINDIELIDPVNNTEPINDIELIEPVNEPIEPINDIELIDPINNIELIKPVNEPINPIEPVNDEIYNLNTFDY
jgi:hypothetical protein